MRHEAFARADGEFTPVVGAITQLPDHAGRKALWEQLQAALEGEPDPWFEHDKAAVDTRQFIPIRPLATERSDA